MAKKSLISFNVLYNIFFTLDSFISKNIEIDFYPFPAGKDHQIPVILDYICVSSQTEHPALAYEFAKFMSYGRDGWAARLKATKELGQVINGFPTADYPEIWTELRETIDEEQFGGLLANLDLIGNGIPDCDKWMPGYGSFWVWVAENAETQGFYDWEADQLAAAWEQELTKQIAETKTKLGLE